MTPKNTTRTGSALKEASGWFAAGDSFRRALTGLSDGAFKLFAYICLEADRRTGRLLMTQTELGARKFWHKLLDRFQVRLQYPLIMVLLGYAISRTHVSHDVFAILGSLRFSSDLISTEPSARGQDPNWGKSSPLDAPRVQTQPSSMDSGTWPGFQPGRHATRRPCPFLASGVPLFPAVVTGFVKEKLARCVTGGLYYPKRREWPFPSSRMEAQPPYRLCHH
jgi:hypothetical protein